MSAVGYMYGVEFEDVAVSAAQDLFEFAAAAGAGIQLVELHLVQSTETAESEEEILRPTIKRVTGSPTSGSGGTSPGEQPLKQNAPAALFTAEANNTTQISGGTEVIVRPLGFQVRMGEVIYTFPPEIQVGCDAGDHLVVALDSAPADSVTMSGYATVLELRN